ncbi:Karyopherin transporter [Ascosphaera acerosa]|nr:Karyopherin transporter [Ascosphaera acerosa]
MTSPPRAVSRRVCNHGVIASRSLRPSVTLRPTRARATSETADARRQTGGDEGEEEGGEGRRLIAPWCRDMAASIAELDQTVAAFYEGSGEVRQQAQKTLTEFKQNPDAWLLVGNILQESTYLQTKYLGLQVLDDVINTKWKVLPRDQCQGIRNFIVSCIIDHSTTEESLKSERPFLNKLNLVLVSILKQEWPHNWPTFISEIVASSHTSLAICENNMVILRLLSEEVFDFSQEQLTSTKAKNLKTSMSQEFSQIFQLASEVLSTADSPSLIEATLETLLRFLNWIPLGYIFETPIIDTLITRFLGVAEFRNVTLNCLTEIGGLPIGPQYSYDEKLVMMFTSVLTTVSTIIPLSLDLKQTYASSNTRDQEFVLNLGLFLTNFFGVHLPVSQSSVGIVMGWPN